MALSELPPRGAPRVKPYTRWTADTETAFLTALRLTGQVKRAAGEIGRSLTSAYKRRERDPEFAARWDAVIAEQQRDWVEGAATPDLQRERPLGRERFDGWTAVRRRAFLRALSETGAVREACRRVQVSSTAAYRLRADSPEFAAQWDAALERSTPLLEQVAWERAVEGWEEPVIAGGKTVGTRRRYSEPLLKMLLEREGKASAAAAAAPMTQAEREAAAQAAAKAAGGSFSTPEQDKEAIKQFMAEMDLMHERLLADGESEQPEADRDTE